MSESWKGPEEDNMSVGELGEWLLALPKSMHHLPITVTCGDVAVSVNMQRLSFTDGSRYYSASVLQSRQLFTDVHLEIDAGIKL